MFGQRFVLFILVVCLSQVGCQTALRKPCTPQPPNAMSLEQLLAILKGEAGEFQGDGGLWEFRFDGIPMALLTSVTHDRMRIIAPILKQENLKPDQRSKMLNANFHTALDARYAESSGLVYATYIHPLSPLRSNEVRAALNQVAQLVKTFGTTYSSGNLGFTDPNQPGPEAQDTPSGTAI